MYIIRTRMGQPARFEYINPFVPIAGVKPHRADLIVTSLDLTSLQDNATGINYVLLRQFRLFNLLAPKSAPGGD